MASADSDRRDEESVDHTGVDEEDTGAPVVPIVRLEEVPVTTGEEEEEILLDLKSKLYRFDREGNQWKERGVGNIKLLKHNETGKVRLIMRQSKTLKICANHYVLPTISLQEHIGNEKSCVWHAPDFSDGELKEELFCIRFGSVENCKQFRDMIEEVAESQKKVENEESTPAASLMEKLFITEDVGKTEKSDDVGKTEKSDDVGKTEKSDDVGKTEKSEDVNAVNASEVEKKEKDVTESKNAE